MILMDWVFCIVGRVDIAFMPVLQMGPVIIVGIKIKEQPMKPIKFEEQTKELEKPSNMTEEECSSLPVHNDGRSSISCWTGDFWERLKFLITGKIWLEVHGGVTQPPVSLSVEFPFVVGEK